ncbi:MAG TPA: ABC transporter substrate-binding protein [Streptosporangiaceae bacterium]|jgi:sulfonate transport system substrate-binding protein|nr:ABC transporter substrate-binding protein [Streptosporangiaceae bacterium]
MINKAPLAVTAALLAAGLVATACSSNSSTTGGGSGAGSASASASGTASGSTTSLSNVTLNIGDQAGSGSEALLTAAGLINKLPFKVHWSDFTSGPPMLQAMGAGSVDIGAVGDAPPIFAAAGGEKIAVVAATVGNPKGTSLLVPKGSSVHSVAQLKGKKIAVAEGSSSDYHLVAVLKQAGLTTKEVSIVNLQPAQAAAAFGSGQVDAWDVWSPFAEQSEAQHGARVLVNGAPIGKTYSFEVASRTALADPAKAAAIRDYLKLIAQAHAWADTHQPVWAQTWSKATGLPLSIMTKAAADDTAVTVPITPAVISTQQSVANVFTAAGLIPGHVDFANFAVTTFNSTAGSSS